MGKLIINSILYLFIFKVLAFGALGVPSYITASDEKYDGKILVQWGGVTGTTYYEIAYKAPNASTFSTKRYNVSYEGSIYSELFYTSIEGLYTFKVRACDSSGCGNFTSEESGSIQPQAVPEAISNLSATDGSYADKIYLSWSSVTDATSYKILIHQPSDENGVYSITKTVNSNAYEYSTTIVGTYYFKVQACNDAGCSDESSAEGGSISAPTPPTQKPTNLSATDGTYQDSIKITWSSVENASYYKLYYAGPQDSTFSEVSVIDTFYYLSTTYLGDYTFKLQGCNSDGCSPMSDLEIGSIAEAIPNSAPTNLIASNGTYTDKISVSWNAVTNATNYKVYIKVPNSDTYSYEFSNSTTYDYYTSVEGNHYFKVQACSGAGCSDLYSNEDDGYIKVLAPSSPPINISATNSTYTDKIKLSWSSVSGADTYRLYYQEPNSLNYSSSYISVNSTSYDFVTSTVGAYYFKVKACNSSGCSSLYSNEASGSIKEIILPSPPSSFVASQGSYENKIHLEWSKVDEVIKYEIYYKQPNSSTFNSVTYDVVYDGSLYSYLFSTYTEGVYSFKIRSCNSNGCGEFSSEITGYIQPASVPQIPSNLEVSNEVYEDKIELNWNSTADTTYYNIFIHKPSDDNGVYSLTQTATTNSYSYYTNEVGTHYFKIESCNDVGCSSQTSAIEGALKSTTIPSKPITITATKGEYKSDIKITWGVSDNATYYKLYIKEPNSNYYELLADNLKDRLYIYTTSTKGDFYFKVEGCNINGCSIYSEEASGYIANLAPTSAPTNLIATKGESIIKVSWSSVKDATYYRLYVKKPNSLDYETIIVNGNYYDYSTTLVGEYYFRVQACNGAGCYSGYSSEVLGYTELDTLTAPINLTASKGTKESSISVNWDIVENASYYKLYYKEPNKSYYDPNYFTVANNSYNFSTTFDGLYYFKVKACKNESCSANYSNEDSGYIEIKGLSEEITTLSSTKGEYTDKIEINWDLIDNINCYKLYSKAPNSSSYKFIDYICFDESKEEASYNFKTTESGNYYFKIYPCVDEDKCGLASNNTVGYIQNILNFSPTLLTISLPYSEYLKPNHFFIYLTKDEELKSSDLSFYINEEKVTPLEIIDNKELIVKLPFDKLIVGENRVEIKNLSKTVTIKVYTKLKPFREAFENGGFVWSSSGGIGKSLKFEVEILGVKVKAKAGISATLELSHKDGIDTVVVADSKEVGSLLYGIPIEDTISAKVEATLFTTETNILDSENAKAELSLGNIEGGASCSISRNLYPINMNYPENKEEIAMFIIPYIGQQIIPSVNSFAQIGSEIIKGQSSFYKDIYKTECVINSNFTAVNGEVSISAEKNKAQVGASANIKIGEYQKLKRSSIISGSENTKEINLVRKYYSNYSKDNSKVLYLEYGIDKGEYIARVLYKLGTSIKYENFTKDFDVKEVTYYLSESDYNYLLKNYFDIDTFLSYQFSTPTLIETKLNSSVDSIDLNLLSVKGAIGIEVGGELKYSAESYESVLYELAYMINGNNYTIYSNRDRKLRDVDLSKFYGKDLIVESLKSIDKDEFSAKLETYLKSLIGDIVNVTKEVIKEGVYEVKDEFNKQVAKVTSGIKVELYKIKSFLRESQTTNLNSANLTFVSDILAIEIEDSDIGSEISIYPNYGTLESSSIFKYSSKEAKWERVDSTLMSDFIMFEVKESGLYAIIKDFISSDNDIFSQTSINVETDKSTALTSNQLKTTLGSIASNKSFEITISDEFIIQNESVIYGESPISINSNIESNQNGELQLGIISGSYEGEATLNIKSSEGYLVDTFRVYVTKAESLKPIENFDIDISLTKSSIIVGDKIEINIITSKSYTDEDIKIIHPNGYEINGKTIEIDSKGEWKIIAKVKDVNGFWHEETLTFEAISQTSMSLTKGWNLKGNPLSANLNTTDVRELFGDGEYWVYESEWIKNPSKIKPLQGFWVKSNSNLLIKLQEKSSSDEAFNPSSSGWSLMGVDSENNLITFIYKYAGEIIYSYKDNIWYNSTTNPNKLLNLGDGYWIKR